MRTAVALASLFIAATFIAAARSAAPAQTPAAAAARPASPSASEIEKEIVALEQQEAQAFLRSDTSALERLWAEDLLVTTSRNKIHTGAEVLALVKSGAMKLTTLERRIERVGVHGQVAVVMGEEIIVPAGGDNAGKTLKRRYTDVFAQKDNQWKLIARQATLIP